MNAWNDGCANCRHSDGYREGRCEWLDAEGRAHVVIRRAPCGCPYGRMLRTMQGRDGKESPPLDCDGQEERWRRIAARNGAIVRSVDWTGQGLRYPEVGWSDTMEQAAERIEARRCSRPLGNRSALGCDSNYTGGSA